MKQPESEYLLSVASCHMDPCMSRGRVCRGAFVVASGTWYLTKDGTWTYGVGSDSNWWDTKSGARDFLDEMLEPASTPPQRETEGDGG